LRAPRAVARAALAAASLAAVVLACALPPDYPPDETHLSATEPERCFDCHVEGTGPRPHPSHYTDDGTFKVKRLNCHNCHEPEPVEPPASPEPADG
jgi:hypothetical protein